MSRCGGAPAEARLAPDLRLVSAAEWGRLVGSRSKACEGYAGSVCTSAAASGRARLLGSACPAPTRSQADPGDASALTGRPARDDGRRICTSRLPLRPFPPARPLGSAAHARAARAQRAAARSSRDPHKTECAAAQQQQQQQQQRLQCAQRARDPECAAEAAAAFSRDPECAAAQQLAGCAHKTDARPMLPRLHPPRRDHGSAFVPISTSLADFGTQGGSPPSALATGSLRLCMAAAHTTSSRAVVDVVRVFSRQPLSSSLCSKQSRRAAIPRNGPEGRAASECRFHCNGGRARKRHPSRPSDSQRASRTARQHTYTHTYIHTYMHACIHT